jgi:hypothetical protein
LYWKTLMYFTLIGNIVQTFGIFYDHSSAFCVHFIRFSGFGITFHEKSGNPAAQET